MSKRILRAEKLLERRMKEIRRHFHVAENPFDSIHVADLTYKFCPKCNSMRNMIKWGSGPSHNTAKCVQCKTEWVFDCEGNMMGHMRAKSAGIVTLVPFKVEG